MVMKQIDKQMLQSQLQEFLEESVPYTAFGQVATYIPELGKGNPQDLAISVTFADGETISAGESNKKFTLQSISKIFTLMIALQDKGFDHVFSRVGMEPTGDPFNSIVKLETIKPHRPFNPMINAGAIAVTSLIEGSSNAEKEERILGFLQRLTGKQNLTVNEEVYHSELQSADRNRALAYFMKDSGVIEGNIDDILDLYIRHCAIELTALDISRAASVICRNGKDIFSNEQLIPEPIARACKTFMITCGMYNASGEFAITAGIPAKSGVSGGIMACVPNRMGIGVFGPALDDKGNSIAGVKLLEKLSQHWNLSIF